MPIWLSIRLHHDEHLQLRRIVASRGAILLYLSPYSPEFNPIEQAFKAVQLFVEQRTDIRVPQSRLSQGFQSIGSEQAEAYFRGMYSALAQLGPE